MTKVVAWLTGLSLTSATLVVLQVRGRRGGRLRNNVLVAATHNGHRYLVSMLGDGSEWVRNVHAKKSGYARLLPTAVVEA